jgi:hypothetical protein
VKEADKNGKKVLIYEILSSEEQKEIKEIIENYYHFDDTKREMGTLGEEGNTLVMCYKDNGEYYIIDKQTKSKINSSENLLSILEKNSGISKNIILKNLQNKWDYGENNEILLVFSFKDQGIQYEYKINPLNGKIIESNKIEKTKFITLDDIEDQGYHFTNITKETSTGNIITFELADKIEYRGEDIIL